MISGLICLFLAGVLCLLLLWRPQNRFSKSLRITLLLIHSLALSVFGLLFWTDDPLHLKAPSDESLIAAFHRHRGAFEKLCQMAVEDNRKRKVWYFGGSEMDGKIPQPRIDEYQKLLSEINSGLVLEVNQEEEVSFGFACGGLLAVGPCWYKGVVFSRWGMKSYGTPAENLDHLNDLPEGYYGRKIEPKWYIYYNDCE